METVGEIRVESRSAAKWNLFDVCFLLMFHSWLNTVCVSFVLSASGVVMPPSVAETSVIAEKQEATAEKTPAKHPLTQLIQQSRTNPSILLLAFLSGVIAGPLAEEFLFRLVLQRYLEKFCLLSLRIPSRSAGIISIIFTSLLFAFLHGLPRKTMLTDVLLATMSGLTIGSILFVVMGTVYLVFFRQADVKDLGWDNNYFGKYLFADIKTAIKYAVFVIPAVMLIHIASRLLLPNEITDPVPIFFFSLVLGFLFYKTRRILPSILLHLFFNGFNFAVLLLYH
jgi:membrane protease YdiL (CAAX protease family)